MSAAERLERFQENEGLRSGLAVFRRRWLTVLGVVIVCVGLAVVRHQRAPAHYAATASVAFTNTTLPDAALQVSSGGSGDPVRDAATEVLIARSQQVASNVKAQLKTGESVDSLLSDVKVEAADNADVLNITATTREPGDSARIANAFANQYIQFKAAAQVKEIEAAENQLRQQINSAPPGSSERSALSQSLQRLGELRAVAGGGANVIGLATPPDSPSGPGLATTVVIGGIIGLAIAFSLVFLLESLDRRVKSVDEFEREYRLPVVASIPKSAFRLSRAYDRSRELEPYRILRSSLDLAAVTRNISTLLITSAGQSEGKTTVAVDLAHAVALDGRRVVLVELDLRRPTFAKQFATNYRTGLTAGLASGAPVEELLIEPFPDLPNLSLLPAGPLPPNPSELLGSDSVTNMLGKLSSKEGLVIVDSPPLNPVADTQTLLNTGAIDASLIVARLNQTTRDAARRARAILTRHMVEPIGIVVTGATGAATYGYGAYPTPRESVNGDGAGAVTVRRVTT